MNEYCRYSYSGLVLEFDHIIDNNWFGETLAPTDVKARNNLVYQYKKQYNKAPRSKITLPGIIRKEDE